MQLRTILLMAAVSLGSLVALSGKAMADEEIVRLPGQGEVKPEEAVRAAGASRLIPGGGLLVSFDTNRDGRITETEIETGVVAAFAVADADESGYLTPLEQIAWAESLPTRDASLANPARFDPNLDRRVSLDEFRDVIVTFAGALADETSGDVIVASLKSAEPRRSLEEPQVLRQERDRRIAGDRG